MARTVDAMGRTAMPGFQASAALSRVGTASYMSTLGDEAWTRIRYWYKRNLPARVFTFEQGASVDKIHGLEDCLGVHLPAEICESYLTHNGLHGCGLSYFGEF